MMKTGLKLGLAFLAGVATTALLSKDTREQIGKAADGVKTDMKARAKKVGAAVAKAWKEEVLGGEPKPPADPKPPTEPKGEPPAASA